MRENALLFLTVLSFVVAAVAAYRLLLVYRAGKPFLTEFVLLAVWLAMLIVCLSVRGTLSG